ncbi:MAG: thioredoxin domain-containing protein, partial [Candidatus Dormibacteraeota bacterium]|nr:thioredoxin domain-containing protein [Candidatus Dormibacteraeota bacterium]
MERESFENPTTAGRMNRDFVCIKVDREERPDLDSIYMSAVQQLTGSGGWPMTVFLTPQLRPFFGGTYFPPEARYGMPGFTQVLDAVLDAYRHRREDVENSAARLTETISDALPGGGGGALERGVLTAAADGMRRHFDEVEGGFGGAPKFPQAMALDFLLRHHSVTGDGEALRMVHLSLQKMAGGGIHDQLGGGFHRYSTDDHWLAPHFEKMLYDQALLVPVYLHAFQVTGKQAYRRTCEGIVDYVLRDLCSSEGGFFSAEDADSEGEEGLYYTWTWDELAGVCGDDLEALAAAYGASPGGNWEGRNILHLATPGTRSVPVDHLAEVRGRLLAARGRRPRPARDEKVLTAWNGLMLAAIAEAGAALGRPGYLRAARANAELMLRGLFVNGRVLRTYRDGRAHLNGYLEDYACLALGLLALYQADFETRWFTAAREIADLMLLRFVDPAGGILFSTSDDHEQLLYRPKDYDDNAVPSGNSIAAEVLLQLALLTGEDRYRAASVRIMAALAPSLGAHPLFFGRLLGVLSHHLDHPIEVAIVGDLASTTAGDMLRQLRRHYLPNKVVAAGPEGSLQPALLAGRTAAGDSAAFYVCRDFACQRPVTTASEVAGALGVGART